MSPSWLPSRNSAVPRISPSLAPPRIQPTSTRFAALRLSFADCCMQGISLMNRIPSDRMCASAHITPAWCMCMSIETVPSQDPVPSLVLSSCFCFR
jgi:hypothetical protein